MYTRVAMPSPQAGRNLTYPSYTYLPQPPASRTLQRHQRWREAPSSCPLKLRLLGLYKTYRSISSGDPVVRFVPLLARPLSFETTENFLAKMGFKWSTMERQLTNKLGATTRINRIICVVESQNYSNRRGEPRLPPVVDIIGTRGSNRELVGAIESGRTREADYHETALVYVGCEGRNRDLGGKKAPPNFPFWRAKNRSGAPPPAPMSGAVGRVVPWVMPDSAAPRRAG